MGGRVAACSLSVLCSAAAVLRVGELGEWCVLGGTDAPRAIAMVSSSASSSAAAVAAAVISCLFWLIVAMICVAAGDGVVFLVAGTVSGKGKDRKASCLAVGFDPMGISGREMSDVDMVCS